jgi:hypothetical protein
MLHLSRFLAAVALGAAALLFALLALRDKMHLFAIRLGDTLSDYALIKTAQQLLNRFSITSFNSHKFA